MSDYAISVLTLMGIESFLALSTYLLLITGQVSFGQQAFFGIGAYMAGAMTTILGFDLGSAILIASLVAGICGVGVGLITLRLGGLYFAIATLAFAEMVRLSWVNLNWQVDLQGLMVGPKGPEGFSGIRYIIDNDISSEGYLTLVCACLIGLLILFWILERSHVGLRLRMIENDQQAAASLGVDTFRHKVVVSGVAASIAGFGGALFAHFMTFIDPMNFGVMLGVHSLAYGMIGGLGSALGPLIGVAIDIGLLESLRFLSSYRMIVFGCMVAVILIVRPRGILDERTVHALRRAARAWFLKIRPIGRAR
jgi:branched-chain amino acid transport system permease protein